MENEFGYLDITPFEKIDNTEQKLVIINKEEDSLKLKVKDVEKFNVFDYYGGNVGKIIETKVFYGIDSKYCPLTLYRCNINNTSLNSIPYTTLSSQLYVKGNIAQDPIAHFTNKSKIKKINYYNNNIRYIFHNNTMIIKYNKNKVNLEAKKDNPIIIGKINYDDNVITIKLVNNFRHNSNYYDFNIKPISFFEISFKKSVDFNFVLKLSSRIDSIIHLFLLTKSKSKELTLYDTKGNSYELFNLRYKEKEKKQPIFYLDKRDNNKENLIKLFNLLINIDDDNCNSFFPFINFERETTSIEIQILEYYRVLEFTDTEMRKLNGKGKNNLFLMDLLKKYPYLKNHFFGNQANEEIEEEIRSLRNYYSHSGYYVKKLPIPTINPIRYKEIVPQWLYDVKNFVKVVSYLEIYELASIKVSESYLLTHLI